jgi:hypothetical protein
MPRALLVSILAVTALLMLTSPARTQAPPALLPPPAVSPPPAVTYFSGPGVVYFGSPQYTFYGATPLPATVYPSGYGYSAGPVTTYVGLGIFRPRGVRTFYRPGYMATGYPQAGPFLP